MQHLADEFFQGTTATTQIIKNSFIIVQMIGARPLLCPATGERQLNPAQTLFHENPQWLIYERPCNAGAFSCPGDAPPPPMWAPLGHVPGMPPILKKTPCNSGQTSNVVAIESLAFWGCILHDVKSWPGHHAASVLIGARCQKSPRNAQTHQHNHLVILER